MERERGETNMGHASIEKQMPGHPLHTALSSQLSTRPANTNHQADFTDVRTGAQRGPCLHPNNS